MFNFIQDDLDEDDVMMLDTWSQIFIWIGDNANKEEKEQAAVIAYEYLMKHPSGRGFTVNYCIDFRPLDKLKIINVKYPTTKISFGYNFLTTYFLCSRSGPKDKHYYRQTGP